MRPKIIAAQQLAQILTEMPGWHLSDDGRAIGLRLTFKTFSQAFAFMTEMALTSEAIDHHPDWSNSYRRVSIKLTTHDVGGVTELDIHLAQFMHQAAERFGARFDEPDR